MIAAVSGTIAASTASSVGDRDLVEAVDLGAEAFEIFGLPAGGDGRERAAVERALESQHAKALAVAVDVLAPPRHLDRGLVGLGAGIGEEHEIGEGRVGEALGEPLAFRHLEQVGGVPELFALALQRLHEMGMGMAERHDGDAGAEIEIALAVVGQQPGALAPLEGQIGARVGRHDCG